ncbi:MULTISPECIES: VOC family protein [Bradyrhizobium]|uniref:VOC family protein n=1 Tax=Bradyrhizobium TaxID=374 RepID=UPI001FCAFFD2|nr:VOC family protein [Bradyrhizobium sp. CCBAU 15544]
MTDEHPMMAGSAIVFVVSDIAASLAYYRDVLGFEVTFEYGAPLSYACLCRDVVALHLLAAARTKRLPGQGGLCIFVRDVDQLYAELSGRGARPSTSRRIAITACAISTSLMPMAISSPSAWVSRNPAEAMPAQPCWHSSSPEGMICEVFEGYLNVPPCNFMRSCSYLRRALARRHLR